MITAHAEYGKINSLLLKKPESAFCNQEKIESEWKELNYLSAPDYVNSVLEYQKFQHHFVDIDVEVFFLQEQKHLTLDAIYCRDAAIMTDYGLIICRMGKTARRAEPVALESDAEVFGIPILGKIQFPGTVEGGDVAWLDQSTLAVAHSYRTNRNGISQLYELLSPHGIKLCIVDLPHFRGPQDVFHLMSIFSPVASDLAVVYSPLMPIAFRNELLDRSYTLIEVPESEFETMGCNVLALESKVCLMVEGNIQTYHLLEKAGCKVITFRGTDICLKGGGGPTCLTRPLFRTL